MPKYYVRNDIVLACPKCQNKSTNENGLYMTNDEEAKKLRENPCDPSLISVRLMCGVCGCLWDSKQGVAGYKQVAGLAKFFPVLANGLMQRFQEGQDLEGFLKSHDIHEALCTLDGHVKGMNPLADDYAPLTLPLTVGEGPFPFLTDLYDDPTKGI